MPNHITSQVAIHGSEAKIKKLIKDSKIKLDAELPEGDNEFDFNAVIPMPESMHITSGSTTDLGMACYDQAAFDKLAAYGWFNERYDNAKTPAELKAFVEKSTDENDKKALEEGKIALDNIKKYGHKDWYDWACANWGTKWNAYDVHYTDHKFDGDNSKLVIQVNTAWDTPHEIWAKLREQGFTVNGVYYGEMDGFLEIGDMYQDFEAYQNVEVEYLG